MRGYDLTHRAAAFLVIAALTLTSPPALGCGWWGDGEDDDEDAVIVGADGVPVEAFVPAIPDKMARLSAAYRQGDGVHRDPVLARRWAQRAAEAGHAGAMNDLGQMLEAGFGGPSDEAVAAHWFGEASRRGIAGAQHSLAMMLHEGRGVERDPEAADAWLRHSARQGHVSAASDLSELIWSGAIAARSPDEGCFWWFVALREGHQRAKDRCRQAQPTLSDEAVRALQAQAAAWLPNREDSMIESRERGF